MDNAFMAYSDQIIKPVLIMLSKRGTVTCTQVSEVANVPHGTVKNSIRRMLDNGQIARKGKGRKWGYRYYEPTDSE